MPAVLESVGAATVVPEYPGVVAVEPNCTEVLLLDSHDSTPAEVAVEDAPPAVEAELRESINSRSSFNSFPRFITW